jgi:glutamate/tyrosine decarboxylase-like PLP-dependent enzyme
LQQLIPFSLTDNTDTQPDNDEIEKLCREVIKFSVKTNNRNCHNQLFGGLNFYGLAGEWMTSALNTGAYTFEMAPVFTLIEEAVIEKSLQLFGLVGGDGILCPGGSAAIMYGINLARFSKFPAAKTEGNPQGLVMFASEDAHYSMKKGAGFLGIGMRNFIEIRTNEHGQMDVADLDTKINDAIGRNLKPFLVNATCGTTVSENNIFRLFILSLSPSHSQINPIESALLEIIS